MKEAGFTMILILSLVWYQFLTKMEENTIITMVTSMRDCFKSRLEIKKLKQ